MKSTSPVVMLGFNELSPVLMDQFIAEGKLPNFARMKAESQVYVTDAEEIAPNLEPWIQWVTVETGLSYKQHGIFDLADGHKLGFPRIDELLSQSGRKIWICGSMNASFHNPPNGFFLPDPWSVGVDPYPKGEFEDFCDYVRRNVHGHGTGKLAMSTTDHLKFLAFMVRHGFSKKTITRIIVQLAQERSGKFRWKRAVILDRLQWDVFEYYWRNQAPDYSTFFINSTAHFQHMYWRNMDPSPFQIKPSVEEQEEYKDAVQFGYQSMDKIVGECLDKMGPDTVIILASALSQQPSLVDEDQSGKIFYRANEPADFFAFAGITAPYRYAPVQWEQFHLFFKEESGAVEAECLLRAMKIGAQDLMFIKRDGQELFGGCTVSTTQDRRSLVTNAKGETKAFGQLFYQVSGAKSGMHHPDGILWIRDGTKKPTAVQRVSLRQVAPTILAHFGVPKQDFMTMDPLTGYDSHQTPVLT
jgi:hypothetical protein